jgi:hypothetical protein
VRITLDDNGAPHVLTDKIGITLWTRSGELWFSSNWNGATTTERTLAAGDVRVRWRDLLTWPDDNGRERVQAA